MDWELFEVLLQFIYLDSERWTKNKSDKQK